MVLLVAGDGQHFLKRGLMTLMPVKFFRTPGSKVWCWGLGMGKGRREAMVKLGQSPGEEYPGFSSTTYPLRLFA